VAWDNLQYNVIINLKYQNINQMGFLFKMARGFEIVNSGLSHNCNKGKLAS